MADRVLVNSYLRSAWEAEPTSVSGRLAWLRARAAELDEALQSGDWEVTSTSFSGASSASKRNLDARSRLSALEVAIAMLEGDPEATRLRSGPLIPRFPDLYNPD